MISRLELAISHMIFLHPHKSGILVGFRVAIAAVTHNEQLWFIRFPLFQQMGQAFPCPLRLTFSPNEGVPSGAALQFGSVHKYRPVVCLSHEPHEVHTVPAGLLQLSTGIDSTQVSVHQYLKHHLRIGCWFSPSGRIGAIQCLVIQLLQHRAYQPDRCILRYHFFGIQHKYQLTSALIYAILVLLYFFLINYI